MTAPLIHLALAFLSRIFYSFLTKWSRYCLQHTMLPLLSTEHIYKAKGLLLSSDDESNLTLTCRLFSVVLFWIRDQFGYHGHQFLACLSFQFESIFCSLSCYLGTFSVACTAVTTCSTSFKSICIDSVNNICCN